MISPSVAPLAPEKKIAVVVIHGVGETETGWINDYIVEPLSTARADLQPTAYSELHSLPGGGRSHGGGRFNTLLRRASHGADRISFAELVWADLSRVGRGSLAYIAATIKLFFEAPDVLAQGFLRNRRRGIHWLIGFLVLTSSRLLKWFVVGLNLVVIACAAYMAMVLGLVPLINDAVAPFGVPHWSPRYDRTGLIVWLAPVMVVLIVLGSTLFVRRRHRDIGLSEFGLGVAISACIALLYLAADYAFVLERFLPILKANSYFDNGRNVVFLVWALWCVSTIAAIALLLLVWLARVLGWRANNPVPLAATWAAIFNILIQAIILKLIITPVSLMSCRQLNTAAGTPVCDQLASTGVLFFSLFETACIVLTLLYVLHIRRGAATRPGSKYDAVPRLIVHPLLVVAAAVTVAMHIAVFAGEMARYFEHPSIIGYDVLPAWLRAAVTAAIPAYLLVLRTFHSAAGPFVHIAREIVDHQYRVTPAAAGLLGGRRSAPVLDNSEYPRRALIAARLNSVMENLVAADRVDTLIFLTHSQGTVVAFDYLRAREPSAALDRIGEIHMVTLGSPLSHLYAYYFDEYARPLQRSELRGNVRSRVNFWRIDDPIGNRVDIVAGDFIDNRPLGPGGHVDYWKEDAVRDYICTLLGSAPLLRQAGEAA